MREGAERRAAIPQARLREVASAVGVNPSTVSRALNPRTRHLVSAEIARRVDAEAQALGYRPNAIASSLRTKRSYAVAVILPDITNPFFPPLLLGIEDRLRGAGYTALVASVGHDPARQGELVATMRARGVDGFVLATARRSDPEIRRHAGAGLPVVLVNRTAADVDASRVFCDDAAGIALLVDHLASLGHVRIAHVAGPQDLSTGHERRRAFLAAVNAAGGAADPALVAVAPRFAIAEGRAALLRLIEAGPSFTAVVAANDLLALGCYEALDVRGLACPGRISVTGYNDMPFVDRMSPPLTTIRVDAYAMGQEAASALVAAIADPLAPRIETKLVPALVVRASTAPPR